MRKIEFRGKRTDTGEWVYGNYVYCEKTRNKYGIERNDIHIIIPFLFDENMPNNDILVIPETVGQFTGLLGKNGVKIFEGDIAIDHERDVGDIFWCEKKAKFAWIKKYEWDLYSRYGLELEVIGNIYDNPELLEDE